MFTCSHEISLYCLELDYDVPYVSSNYSARINFDLEIGQFKNISGSFFYDQRNCTQM